jgi:hypothetical protein
MNAGFVSAAASFMVVGFSCTPSEVVVGASFSCTAQVQNVGDATGSISIATLYPDSPNWLENSNYAQSSGTAVTAGQSVEITFSGLKAVKSGGANGFSKIMLDDVTDTYVGGVDTNTIDVVVAKSASVSSAEMGGSITLTGEVTAGGNINALLTLSLNSGGCNMGSQSSQQNIGAMQDGNKQSKVWTITQGTSGACSYTLSVSATGAGGVASKLDTTSGSIRCTNCPSSSSSSSSSSSGGGGGGGGSSTSENIKSLGELTAPQSAEVGKGQSISFSVSGKEYSFKIDSVTATSVVFVYGRRMFTLEIGDVRIIDMDMDGMSEVSVKVLSINTLSMKANLELAPIRKEVKGGSEGGGKEEKIKTSVGEILRGEGGIWSVIIIVLIIAILAALIGILYKLKKASGERK